jgi:hypothetical protein
MTAKELIERRLAVAEADARETPTDEAEATAAGFADGLRAALRLLDEADAVGLAFDTAEAKGAVTLARGPYGATLKVDGRDAGYVDLFPATEGNPPQLVLEHPDGDDLRAKVLLWPDGRQELVVSRTVSGPCFAHPRGIHSDWDRVFELVPAATPEPK